MKKLPATGTSIALTLLLVVAALAWVRQSSAAAGDSQTVTSTFMVEGMTCGGCELGVKLAVKKLEGVESVDGSYQKGEAEVVYHPEKVTPDDIIAAIEELGYTAELVDEGSET
jgi:Cu+-exporting ATPase